MTAQPDTAPAPTTEIGPAEAAADAVELAVAERHRPHERAQFPASCRLCRDEKVDDIYAELDQLTCNLLDHVGTALPEVLKAQDVIGRLMSPEVYDVEFVETDDGPDVYAELATAARALRNVERIGIHRRQLLLAQAQESALAYGGRA